MRIFLSPLDWGLGHAARCVPIINYLLEKNLEVIIGAEGRHLLFLKEHFPQAKFIEFPGYRVSYSNTLPVNLKVLLQVPTILAAVNKEHNLLTQLVEQKKIDAVISDNRYGLWNKQIPSIIITHQLTLQTSAGRKALNKTIHNHIKHFDECWIPDYADQENLSGTLSHPIPKGIQATYMGPLSRFNHSVKNIKREYDLFVILSGPEPQRSILEELIVKQLQDLPLLKVLIVQGLPGNARPPAGDTRIKIVPHLSDKDFLDAIDCSELIISRPGYSTIMDLHTIGWKKSIFIPTPGQTEQEYLGDLMQEKGLAISCHQKGFLLKDALEKAQKLNPAPLKLNTGTYKAVLDIWLEKIRRS